METDRIESESYCACETEIMTPKPEIAKPKTAKPKTGPKAESVVKCWRNKEDPNARKGYKDNETLENKYQKKKPSEFETSQ